MVVDKTISVTTYQKDSSKLIRCATAGHAFDIGDHALRYGGCDRYVVRFDSGAAPIMRRRIYNNDGLWDLSDYTALREESQ